MQVNYAAVFKTMPIHQLQICSYCTWREMPRVFMLALVAVNTTVGNLFKSKVSGRSKIQRSWENGRNKYTLHHRVWTSVPFCQFTWKRQMHIAS